MTVMTPTRPVVQLVNTFERPFDNAVATARTCYSGSGIITPEKAAGEHLRDPEKRERAKEVRDRIAQSIFEAGHHTTLQHAHFQFAIANVSRQFIWSFLHSHMFYNSEQVSQRYVEVKEDNFVVPPLPAGAHDAYMDCIRFQMEAYRELRATLMPVVERSYFKVFPARRSKEKYAKDIEKKSQEVARYVLPLATSAFMYHTISGITLLRYHRIARQQDTPWEQLEVVNEMVRLMLDVAPEYRLILESMLNEDELPESAIAAGLPQRASDGFIDEFDASLDGRVSKLVDWKINNETALADSVREVFGLRRAELTDDAAIALALDPSKNTWLGETMNLNHHTKLSRTLFHPSYTFRKRISHTADSQDQRHRMTPGSRPILARHMLERPDYITPILVLQDEAVRARYDEIMARCWDGAGRLRALGVPEEFVMYVMPNAVAVRFTESSDLLNLHHKLKARLCYNAQEEIWQASLDETEQIKHINPRIGEYILPPCGLRKMAGRRPFCPEGPRYCGVPVWTLDLKQYERVI